METNNKDSKPFIFSWYALIKSYPTQNRAKGPIENVDLNTETLSSQAKRLAFALGSYADNTTGVCWPNIKEHLFKECGLTRSDYNNGKKELLEAGLLSITQSKKAIKTARGTIPVNSNQYHLVLLRVDNNANPLNLLETHPNNILVVDNSAKVMVDNNPKVSVDNSAIITHSSFSSHHYKPQGYHNEHQRYPVEIGSETDEDMRPSNYYLEDPKEDY